MNQSDWCNMKRIEGKDGKTNCAWLIQYSRNSGNTQMKYIDIITEMKKGKLNTEAQIVLKWCDTVETLKEDKLSVLKWLLKQEKNVRLRQKYKLGLIKTIWWEWWACTISVYHSDYYNGRWRQKHELCLIDVIRMEW